MPRNLQWEMIARARAPLKRGTSSEAALEA